MDFWTWTWMAFYIVYRYFTIFYLVVFLMPNGVKCQMAKNRSLLSVAALVHLSCSAKVWLVERTLSTFPCLDVHYVCNWVNKNQHLPTVRTAHSESSTQKVCPALIYGVGNCAHNRGHLRSAARGDLAVPRSRTTRYGQRCFAVSGPTLWNSLPLSVRDPSLTLTQFCACLNTALFCRAYETLA